MVQGNEQTLILGTMFLISQFVIQFWLPAVIRERTKRKIVRAAVRKKIGMDEAEKLLELLGPERREDTAPVKAPARRSRWKWWPP